MTQNAKILVTVHCFQGSAVVALLNDVINPTDTENPHFGTKIKSNITSKRAAWSFTTPTQIELQLYTLQLLG